MARSSCSSPNATCRPAERCSKSAALAAIGVAVELTFSGKPVLEFLSPTAAALQDLLDQQETALAPETVAQLKASLRTIDEAILEARNALARDPNNTLLIEMLSANYKQKVDLLRRSTEMTRGS